VGVDLQDRAGKNIEVEAMELEAMGGRRWEPQTPPLIPN